MKYIVAILLFILVIAGVGAGAYLWYKNDQMQTKYGEVTVKGETFKVELANTQEKRELGLGGRTSLADDEGMLFVFSASGFYPFWMKDMEMPIDIIWINDGLIADVAANVPAPVEGEKLGNYYPVNPGNLVLEVNAGVIDKLGIKIGDPVQVNY